jgi:hypothetical protein
MREHLPEYPAADLGAAGAAVSLLSPVSGETGDRMPRQARRSGRTINATERAGAGVLRASFAVCREPVGPVNAAGRERSQACHRRADNRSGPEVASVSPMHSGRELALSDKPHDSSFRAIEQERYFGSVEQVFFHCVFSRGGF